MITVPAEKIALPSRYEGLGAITIHEESLSFF